MMLKGNGVHKFGQVMEENMIMVEYLHIQKVSKTEIIEGDMKLKKNLKQQNTSKTVKTEQISQKSKQFREVEKEKKLKGLEENREKIQNQMEDLETEKPESQIQKLEDKLSELVKELHSFECRLINKMQQEIKLREKMGKNPPELKILENELRKVKSEHNYLEWKLNLILLCRVQLENELIEKIRFFLNKSKNKTKVIKGTRQTELSNLRCKFSQLEKKIQREREIAVPMKHEELEKVEQELDHLYGWENEISDESEFKLLKQKGGKKIKNSKHFPYLTEFGVLYKKEKRKNYHNLNRMNFLITKTWDNQKVDHTPVKISLHSGNGDEVIMEITAPFFNDPVGPEGVPGEPFNKLWDYEVVEAFFLGKEEKYLEVEFSPHGQHLLLLLAGRGDAIKLCLPVKYVSSISGNEWSGTAKIPAEYFPPSVHLFNAYAIHGSGDNRIYEALFPVPMGHFVSPNFHRLEFFSYIEFGKLLPSNSSSKLSPLWKQALKDKAEGIPLSC